MCARVVEFVTTQRHQPDRRGSAAHRTGSSPRPRLVRDLTGLCPRLIPAIPEQARSARFDDSDWHTGGKICMWTSVRGSAPHLTVIAQPHLGRGTADNADLNAANEAFEARVQNLGGRSQPVHGLGDRAVAAESDGGTHLVVLTRNVTIAVKWSALAL